MKTDPSFLEVDKIAAPKLAPYEYQNPSLTAMSASADQGLSPAALQRVDEIVAASYAKAH